MCLLLCAFEEVQEMYYPIDQKEQPLAPQTRTHAHAHTLHTSGAH